MTEIGGNMRETGKNMRNRRKYEKHLKYERKVRAYNSI